MREREVGGNVPGSHQRRLLSLKLVTAGPTPPSDTGLAGWPKDSRTHPPRRTGLTFRQHAQRLVRRVPADPCHLPAGPMLTGHAGALRGQAGPLASGRHHGLPLDLLPGGPKLQAAARPAIEGQGQEKPLGRIQYPLGGRRERHGSVSTVEWESEHQLRGSHARWAASWGREPPGWSGAGKDWLQALPLPGSLKTEEVGEGTRRKMEAGDGEGGGRGLGGAVNGEKRGQGTGRKRVQGRKAGQWNESCRLCQHGLGPPTGRRLPTCAHESEQDLTKVPEAENERREHSSTWCEEQP